MEERAERLCDAALRGDMQTLENIMQEDNLILDKVCVGSFRGNNPLHVAISKEQREFVLKLLEYKPDLAEVLDAELRVALHLASAKGHLQIVKDLVERRPGMCLARDRNGYNPLHVAVIKGQVDVVRKLVEISRRRAKVKDDRGDTIFHLCVKYYQFDCLKELLQMIPDPKFINAADVDGNTILHLAVSEKKSEMIETMLSSGIIQVNAVNGNGETALDIIHLMEGGNPTGSEIQRILLNAGAKTRQEAIVEKLEPKWRSERRNTLMIVASLILTMTFQVGMNPPGGVWQDTSKDHFAGQSVLAHTNPAKYCSMMGANTWGFLGSLGVPSVLIYSLADLRRVSWFALVEIWIMFGTTLSVDVTYVLAVRSITPKGSCYGLIGGWPFSIIHTLWFFLIAILTYRERLKNHALVRI